ncbi:hypothetical protein SAMN06297229_0167 [Pseudidiomarina planktonica]|uniref:Uncharacterized protein n=1 Tax=Pseudidiomarina planktonica TaxID=1323738 RepID=A0A1Y6E7Z5_9GAMM|nr:hypothetical protein [Pseudidiomarina planktonica]RUO66333.1 hypothetical protein CWI77_07895 [Pseudidiomarina planktonica]SMQ58764.1 hypothetical protein SAMN06297229_0167 [Pseudidiomarina planktonica]
MSIQLLSKKSTLKLCSLALITLGVSGCGSMYEEHQRASAIQSQAYLARALSEYQNAGTTRGDLWQMPSGQSVRFEERLRAHADTDLESYLNPGNSQAVGCNLDAATRDWVVYQVSSEQLRASREAEAKLGTRTQSPAEVTIISGNCRQGKLEGNFVALYRYDYSFLSPNMSSSTQMIGRSEGTMKNGVPHGELRATNRDISSFSFSPEPRTIDQHLISDFNNGERVGSSVNLARTSSGDVLTVTEVISDRRQLGLSWMQGVPNTRYFLLDGKIDGYMQFANAMLSDSPTCYRLGEQLTSNSYCESIKNDLEALVAQSYYD